MSPQGSVPLAVCRPVPAVCAAMRSSMFEQGFYVLSTAVMTPSRYGVTAGASAHQLSYRVAQGTTVWLPQVYFYLAKQFLLSRYNNNKEKWIV